MTRNKQKQLIKFDKPVRPRLWVCNCTHLPFRERKKLWRVYTWHLNHSAFNGYKPTYSDYSGVMCLRCNRHWRTKAKYVNSLLLLARTLEETQA